MNHQFKHLALPYFDIADQLLFDWSKINSCYDETTSKVGQPFGKGVKDALNYIGKVAEKDGFNVAYNDGYATEISYGQGPIIGVYAHADVVPVSGSWTYPPFSGTIANGRMYGRGTSDDKGPAMAAYLAMKLLKDKGLINGYTARLVIGGNEERGSACLHYYFHTLKKPQAVAGFTPDGEFPLIYGEKGISNYKLEGIVSLNPIHRINAGVVSNSVIDRAEAIVDYNEKWETYLKATKHHYEIEHINNQTRLVIFGKAAHGSLPELGIHAGLILLDVLGNFYKLDFLTKLAQQYRDPFGHNLEAYYESKLLHHTTYNVGLINYESGVFSMVVNFRYPETVDLDATINKIAGQTDVPVTILMRSHPLLFDPNSSLVQILLKAYQQESGDFKSQMMTIGGGTYAKEAHNIVAFGSHFPNKDDHIHDVDEKIDLVDLHSSIGIYARAIYDLGMHHALKK